MLLLPPAHCMCAALNAVTNSLLNAGMGPGVPLMM